MSARWKRENPDTLLMMHAHNQWSRFNGYLLQAAEDLGIPVCLREYANHYDGSHDREWIVPRGCRRVIQDRAIDMRTEYINSLHSESDY